MGRGWSSFLVESLLVGLSGEVDGLECDWDRSYGIWLIIFIVNRIGCSPAHNWKFLVYLRFLVLAAVLVRMVPDGRW